MMDLSKVSDEDLLKAASPDTATVVSFASKKYDVPEELLHAVIKHESAGDQSAVSPKGARGKMQLMPDTAKELGVNPDDPVENVLGGAQYLKQQKDRFGTWDHALWAYNAGPGRVKDGIKPKETKTYMDRIINTLGEMLGPSEAHAAEIPKTPQQTTSQPLDLSKMSDEELMRAAGIEPPPTQGAPAPAAPATPVASAPVASPVSAGPDLATQPTEDLMRAAGIQPSGGSLPIESNKPMIPAATRIEMQPDQAASPTPDATATPQPDSWIGRQLEVEKNWLESPVAPATSLPDRLGRQIPEGVEKAVYQAGKGAVGLPFTLGETAHQALDIVTGGKTTAEDLYTPYLQMVKGIYDAIGVPLGLSGIEEAKKRWDEDPGGAITNIAAMFLPLKGKGKGKPVPETGIPAAETMGENLRKAEPAPAPQAPLTPVSKSAAESAKVFMEELDKPKNAAESAQVFEAAAGRGELPGESPATASPVGKATEPPLISQVDRSRQSDTIVNQSKPIGTPIDSHFTKVWNEIDAKRTEKGLPPIERPSILKSEGGFLNVGDIVNAAREMKERARALGLKLTVESQQWINNVIATGKRDVKKTDQLIDRAIYKAIRPGVEGQRAFSTMANYQQRARTAVKEIVRNKDNLGLVDDFGNATSRLPQSLSDFSQAIDATKRKIFEKYDSMATEAGQAGAKVELAPIVEQLKKEARNKVTNDLAPNTAKYASERIEALSERKTYTVTEAQEALKVLNKSLEAFYKNPSYETASRAYVDSLIADGLRGSLDSVIENAKGPGYAELRRSYGALKAIEKDVNRRAVVDLSKANKNLPDVFFDSMASHTALTGLVTANPAAVASGGLMKVVKDFVNKRNDPNRTIKSMFEDADKAMNQRNGSAFLRGLEAKTKNLAGDAAGYVKDKASMVDVTFPAMYGAGKDQSTEEE
jgi:hypothetical protein